MEKKIIRIGQASVDGSQAGNVYGKDGMMVTLTAGVHGYAMGYVLRKYGIDNSRNDRKYGTTGQGSWQSDRGGYKSFDMFKRLERPHKGTEKVWKEKSLSWAA